MRHLAKVAEGTRNQTATIFRKPAKLLHRTANLLSLRQRETLHRFGAVKDPLALLRRHVIQLRQAIAHTLLGRQRKIAKAGLIFQSALLLREGKVAVTVHPLGQMLLISLRLRPLSGPRLRDGRTECPPALCAGAGWAKAIVIVDDKIIPAVASRAKRRK
ncbi:hypothetical protein RBB78_14060 [Tunturiibacter empetritectus]